MQIVFSAGPSIVNGTTADAGVYQDDPAYQLASGVFEIVFTADVVSGVVGLLSKDSVGRGDGGQFSLYMINGVLYARLQDDAASYTAIAGAPIAAGARTHVAVVFGEADGFTLYIDGAEAASNSYAGGLIGNPDPLVVGADQYRSKSGEANVLDAPFDGSIDFVRLYDAPIDAAGVAQLAADALNADAPPVAADDGGFSLEPGATLEIAAAELLQNDSDPAGLSILSVQGAQNGTVALDADGDPLFTAAQGYTGPASFTYTVQNQNGATDQATVTLAVAEAGAEPGPAGVVFSIGASVLNGTTADAGVYQDDPAYQLASGVFEI
ncbi:MAG: LamG-like jellyroll fold domain-containing protein, partial [Pseudomonadota bacterium]